MAKADRPMPSGGSPYSGGSNIRGTYSNPEPSPAAREKLVDRTVDPDSHNLHAGVGERCMICDKVIERGRSVRRTVSGGYAHDSCGHPNVTGP